MGFFSSLFSSTKNDDVLDDQQKDELRKFDILKYDGIRAQRVGKPEYAVKCFTEALKIQKDFETMKHLMSTYYMLNKPDQALELLSEMVATGEEPASILLTRASLLHSMLKYQEAIADCMQAIEVDPDSHLVYYQLAKTEYALHDPANSIHHLSTAIDMQDDFTDGYMLRAEIYLSTKDGNNAMADIEKVIELTPENEIAYLLRGRVHELLEDTEAAFADYQQAIELNPFNEDAYLLAGRLMMAQEKYDEAITLFDEAIEHNEQFAKAYAERSLAKDKTGDHEGALTDMEKSHELSTDGKDKPDTKEHNFDDLYKGNII